MVGFYFEVCCSFKLWVSFEYWPVRILLDSAHFAVLLISRYVAKSADLLFCTGVAEKNFRDN